MIVIDLRMDLRKKKIMKILVDVISHDRTPKDTKLNLLEDLKEYDVDVVETIKAYGTPLTYQGKQQNLDRERFIINHTDNDFVIHMRGASKVSRDFSTVIDYVNNNEVDILFQSGRRELYIDDTLYEKNDQFLRAILEEYCEQGKNVAYKYPVEYIQNIMLSCAPFIKQYVPYTNEQGAHNVIIGYSKKFANAFLFNEFINPNEVLTCHDALMTASREKLKVKYIKSNAIWAEDITMEEAVNAGIWESYDDSWKSYMKKAIPKFTKNILGRKIEFIN